MDVIIFGGQSNMQGQTECLPENNAPVQGATEYRYKTNELIPLCHPVGEDLRSEKWCAAANLGHGCLVPAFCRAYIQQTGREVIAIHAAKGNTALGDWLSGTQHAYHARRKIAYGIEKAKEQGTIDHIYYVWLQGESDALIHTSEDEYLHRLIEYKNQLKAQFGIEKFGIIKVGYYLAQISWVMNPNDTEQDIITYNENIMRAQEKAAEQDSDFVILTRVCAQLSQNQAYINPRAEGHYNNAGMEIIGKEAGEALANL